MSRVPPASPLAALGQTASERFEKFVQGYSDGLKKQFALSPLEGCIVLVEGATDIEYLTIAADKIRDELGHDLLDATTGGGPPNRIEFRSPQNPTHADEAKRHTGGTPQLIRLIKFLRPYTSVFEVTSRLCFLVDHDDAGSQVLKALKDNQFAVECMGLSHDPAAHPHACSKTDVVVEDLLSLRIQRQFFEAGGCDCRVSFVEGRPTRFEWNIPTKDALPAFVRTHGTWLDVQELARVLLRVRGLWSLPCPDIPFQAVQEDSRPVRSTSPTGSLDGAEPPTA